MEQIEEKLPEKNKGYSERQKENTRQYEHGNQEIKGFWEEKLLEGSHAVESHTESIKKFILSITRSYWLPKWGQFQE